ncbi:MAG: flippase-like domain-containing protein [Bacteroidetes bacterium]|nr:flippase-like domain-containing protein [Bacteroidota bacterium]
MNKSISKILQYILLLSIGVFLCWKFFQTLDFNSLITKVKTGNFSWFYLVMLVSVLVYMIRTLRWQMLIRATGHETKFHNAFAALSISYFVSFVVPRLGEVTRCLSVKKQHDIPFMKLLGTVIIERVVDIVSLIILLFITLVLQFEQIMGFVKANVFQPLYENVIWKIIGGNTALLVVALLILIVAVSLFLYFRKYIRKRSPQSIVKFVDGLKDGLASIAKLEQKKIFILYTFLIWVGYYLMTYFWFFVFKETSALGWGACLSILAIGTIGRSVPIQGGGMGAYHFLVTSVVVLYGLSEEWGKDLATLIHAGQTFFTFAMGLVGLLIFFIGYWRKR